MIVFGVCSNMTALLKTANELILNSEKSNIMTVSNNKKVSPLNVMLHASQVNQTSTIKFLGLHLGPELTYIHT